MKKQDLDALGKLYSSVYDGEQLNEAIVTGNQFVDRILQGGEQFFRGNPRPTGVVTPEIQRAQQYRDSGGKGAPPPGGRPGMPTGSTTTPTPRPTGSTTTPTPRPTGSTTRPTPTPRPTGSTTRPTASGPVLSKKNGVEGTGVGANFKPRAFTDAEKSRYASVAAQNAARTSASSGGSPSSSSSSSTSATSAPKTPTPAIGKLGNTSFERRTPTSAELRAAQSARAGGASPEQALQAAQRTNLPTTGPSPAIPDLKSVSADLRRANPSATSAQIAGASQGIAPATSGTNSINNNNKDKDKPVKEQSQEWPSAKTIKDIADAYASIYEAKKNDGNLANNYPPYDKVTRGDVIAGRLGKDEMGGKKKSTKNEDFELWIDSLLDEGYDLSDYTWDDMYEIYEQQLDEGLGSAIKGLFGGRKKPATPTAPEGRTAQLRRKYGITSRTGPESPRGKILSRAQSQIDADIRKYGEGSTPAKESQAARQKQLKGGYSQFGMNDRRGRGSKARKRAEGLQREDYAIYEIVASYLLENNFAETINDANVIIENMSENWLEEILTEKKWISGAIKEPGAFTKKAKAHGMSTSEFASYVDKHPEKFPTKTERQANLSQTLRKFK